ncbi:uncharacterized protein AB675_10957 [Cyphellophora attinorum]|uniref:Uncharacterized protein n=1 Tax=Cyphellophora attinorum TaxID=1664694 RepID=A0A0N1H3Q8_9EURO|nr:uncharacterized protein AB675_10957 [Phialophora attinorum]KPI35563.1 hypothetical protein AB675_10957 [Phialophora attinorum]
MADIEASLGHAWKALSEDLKTVAAKHNVEIDTMLQTGTSDVSASEHDSARLPVATMLENLSRALLAAIQMGLNALSFAWAVDTMLVLAEAPRTVELWRRYFGLCKRVIGYSPKPQNPDCILDVARRVIGDERLNHDDQLLRAALRIVANCCADNNTNRSLIVYRDGIQGLKALVKAQRHLDLVLPTLFNVCTDFDEAASDIKGEEDVEIFVSCAAADLGKPVGEDSTAVLLIKTHHERFVPALVELSLLPAAFGLKHVLVPAATGHILDPKPLFARLFRYGRRMKSSRYDDTDEWEETRDELSRACISLLRTDDAQIALAKSPESFWDYLECYWNLGEEASPYLPAFRQIVHYVSGRPEYVAAHPVDSDAFRELVENLEYVHDPSSDLPQNPNYERPISIMTLIHNAFSTQQHVVDAVAEFPGLPESVLDMVDAYFDKLPSLTAGIALLTRFSIVPEARDVLINHSIFNALYFMLGKARAQREHLQRPPEVNAARLKESLALINLTRLLIVSRDIVSRRINYNPNFFPDLHSEIMQLPIASFDDDAKHDLGQYCIQVLRCLAAEGSSAKDLPTYGTKTAPFMTAVLHQASSPRSQQTTGIFGLTLLLSSSFTPSLDVLETGAREALTEAIRETLLPLFVTLVERRKEQRQQAAGLEPEPEKQYEVDELEEIDSSITSREDSAVATLSKDAQIEATQAAKTTAHEANLKRLCMELLRLLGDSELSDEMELYAELERLRSGMGL